MEEPQKNKDTKVREASHVYLLMRDEYRISRNMRASWYFTHLHTNLACNPNKAQEDSEELQILSIVPKSSNIPREEEEQENWENERQEAHISPVTGITFLAKRYRLVFVLDISPSVTSVDLPSSEVLLDEMISGLCTTLKCLIKPFCVPGSKVMLTPELYITVIAHSPLINCPTNQVLLQGCLLNSSNLDPVLQQLSQRLVQFENEVVKYMGDLLDSDTEEDLDEDQKLTGGLFDDIVENKLPESPDPTEHLTTPEASFINMLRYGMLALQLLQENSAAAIVILTDGIVGAPDAALFESLMSQLRHNTIACSFIQIGNCYHVQSGLGQVAYSELLQFMANATFGSYFSQVPKMHDDCSSDMNTIQHALLTWSFQRALTGVKVNSCSSHDTAFEELTEDLAWTHRIENFGENKHLWATPLMKKKHTERNLHTGISHLISCRLREGYTIKNVAITKGDSQIEVALVLPWRDNVWIHYRSVSAWPINSSNRNTHVEMTIEGSYDFLHDATCTTKKPFKSPYRTAVVKKYWQTIQGMLETDSLLVHLQSFSSNPLYFNIPDSVKKGVPLFYLPPDSKTPNVNKQHSSKDSLLTSFASFWKPVLMLDVNIWQKWMHTHRISILLEHDKPVGKHLHIANSSGRFHSIACRQAQTALNVFLSDVSTFVLMENHSYVSLIFSENDKPPTSFYVLRVAPKPPCLVLRLAFLGGTPGQQRNKIVADLQTRIQNLKFPQRGTSAQKDDKVKQAVSQALPSGSSTEHTPPLQRPWSETPCCIITAKPIEKLLIRYERMPRDFMTLKPPPQYNRSGHMLSVASANHVASSVFTTLSRYLCHRRWVWSVQHGSYMPISVQAIGRILATITKIRLQEGFHFANANSGIVNLILEVDMKNPDTNEAAEADRLPPGSSTRSYSEDSYPCVMQYLVFPPHNTTTKESLSDEDADEMETTEADGELQVITEMWVEPQYGICHNSTSERSHFDHRDYKELAVATQETDIECISTMITFEHLNLMCQSNNLASPTLPCGTPTRSFNHHEMRSPKSTPPENGIQRVPFAFDLLRLLPKCQQAELLFSSYIQDLSKLPPPKLHCETLTAESGEMSASSDQDLASVEPNVLLFNSFMDKLTTLHACQVHLKDDECDQLLALIVQRDRDVAQHPLPFQWDPAMEDNISDMEESTSSVSLTAETPKSGCHSGEPERGKRGRCLKRLLTDKLQTTRTASCGPSLLQSQGQSRPVATSSPQRSTEEPESDAGKMTVESAEDSSKHQLREHFMDRVTARWRCFIKSITATHIMLSFVPASFDDLRLLTQGQGILSSSTYNEENNKKEEEEQVHPAEPIHIKGIQQIIHSQQTDNIEPGFHVSNTTQAVNSAEESDTRPQNNQHPLSSEESSTHEIKTKPLESKEDKSESEQSNTKIKPIEELKAGDVKEKLAKVDVSTSAVVCPPPGPNVQSLTIPVYVYNCPLSILTDQLVNRWTHQPQPDVFQDLTTKSDVSDIMPEDEFDLQRRRTESENMRERWRQCMEEGQDTVYGNNSDFQQHCTLISEHYFRSFVTGVFQSLQSSHVITCQDVDTAINGICEESVPIEMDITRYLHSMCGHIRQLIERAKIEQMMRDDNAKVVLKSLETKEEVQTVDNRLEDDIPIVLPLSPPPPCYGIIGSPEPVLPLRFPLAILNCERSCEALPGLHNLVRKKFTEIITRSFKPVPSNPDFFFFCPPNFQDSQCENLADVMGRKNQFESAEVGDESELFMSDADDNGKDEKTSECDSVASMKDEDSSTISSIQENDADDLCQDEDDIPPLFVHFTCSIRTRNNTLKSIPMHNLPTCLSELKTCLGEVTGEIDLNDIQVTLDIICLTLPPDIDLDIPTKRPCYNRMTSYNSQVSYASSSPPTSEAREESFCGVDAFLTEEVTASLRILPNYQLYAVNTCKDQVLWLLRDEIASALRMTVPVTATTLEMVANHVKDSDNKPCCIFQTVPLQFVYGPEQSLTHFIESFEKIKLPGYHLNKERGYYYLFMDRARADNIAHAQAISCALQHLDDEPPHPFEPEVYESLHVSHSAPTLHRGELSTLPNLSWNHTKAPETNPQGEVIQPNYRRKDSVVVLSQEGDAKKAEGEDSERGEEVAGKDGATFRAEDIKISVIRPSPVKETPSSIVSGFSGFGEKEKDASETTSGSSIQILDDRDLATEEQPEAEAQNQAKVWNDEGDLPAEDHQSQPEGQRNPKGSKDDQSLPPEESSKAEGQSQPKGSSEEQNIPTEETSQAEEQSLPTGESSHTEGDFHTKAISHKQGISTEEQQPEVENHPQPSIIQDLASKDHSQTEGQSQPKVSSDGQDLATEVGAQPELKAHRGDRDGVTFNDTVDLVSEKDYEEDPPSGAEQPSARDTDMTGTEGPATNDPVLTQQAESLTITLDHPLFPVQGPTLQLSERSGLKRVRSSASFEKYKNSKKRSQTPTRSGPQTPSRSRHQSGLQTPLSGSVFDTSSRGSVGEEGYEAGYSDSDEEGIMLSFNESMVRYPQLPDFWLIMGIEPDRVNVYFHTRDTGTKTTAFKEQQEFFNHIIEIITRICCTVNQRLLLQDLYETRMCNWLLVPEADDDVQWGPHDDKRYSHTTKRRTEGDSDDSDTETVQDRYLEAALHVRPGYFACERVWKAEFILHPRLKTGPRRVGMSQGMQALQVVMQRFSVNNRKNMFVIRESSGAVFYLRLDETQTEARQPTQSVGDSSTGVKYDEDFSLSVSRSSSMLSLPTKVKVPETDEDSAISTLHRSATVSDTGRRSSGAEVVKDDDSMSSSVNMRQKKTEDSIVVSAHGIGQVGPDISVELVNMLQRKLDDAMLEILVYLFVRNPMCKLLPEDVHFIQPVHSAPKETVRLTIPASALLQQFPLGYYLWQNLLQFLHTPKYADPKPENMFRDYSQPNCPPIPENFVFLCSKRPQHAGVKGLACIQQSFVDGRGNPIQLFSSPKPSPYAYRDTLDVAMFESMVSTSLYKVIPRSRTPGREDIYGPPSSAVLDPTPSVEDGPTALVQFNIWQRGDVDIAKLTENLVLAMKHAVCDVIMEYRLLTAPLCEVPQHYTRGMDSPMHSAPPSPVIHGIASDPRSVSVSPGEGGKKNLPDTGGRTPKEKSSAFNLQSFLYDAFKPKSGSKDSPKDSPGMTSQTWQEIEYHRRQEADLRQKVHKYEMGDRGTLQSIYCTTIIDWFEFCSRLNVPSVQKLNCTLMSRAAVEYVLREFQMVVNSILPDMQPKIFKRCKGSSNGQADHCPLYLPYTPARSSHQSSQESARLDTCLDLTNLNQGHTPGRSCHFIGIGRNVKQWRASIDYVDVDEDMVAEFNQLNNPKTNKSHQRFLPLEPSIKQGAEKPEFSCLAPFDRSDKAFVPRQRLLLMTIDDKKVSLYTYNWVQDLHNSLADKFNRLVCWQNARSHLLGCILGQKAGLFHHTIYRNLPPDPDTGEPNMFASCNDVQLLVKYTSPPIQQSQSRSRSTSVVQKSRPALPLTVPVLHDVYRDTKPPTPMHRSTYANLRDPLHRHGAQMLELKRIERKDQEKHDILVNLYKNWQQRMGLSHAPIPEDDLVLLKTSSRLIHAVATPLLFDPHWRKKVINKPTRQDSRSSDASRPRSRHSSGASMRSKRSDSMDSKKRVDSPDISAAKANTEAMWHKELRSSFVSQYIQYLQSVGFVQIRTRSPSPKRGSRHLSGEAYKHAGGDESEKNAMKPDYMYLQKTLPGGIMLLELGFKEVYFCVHVYAYECSRLPFKSINPQLAMMFTDDCEKFKELTHVHSFAHGFHLRTVQLYLTGRLFERELLFKQHYHLTGFLQDFIVQYPYAPSFSRNYVFEGTRNLVLNTNSESHQLFRYMLEHDKMYGMKAIRMVPLSEEDSDPENEYVLVKQFDPVPDNSGQDMKTKIEDYNVGLVITHDTSGSRATDTDRTILRLKYYILLTSKKELFPKHTLEKRLGMFKSSSAKQFPATGLLPASAADFRDDLSLFEPPKQPWGESDGSSEVLTAPLQVAQFMGVRKETTNYLGYCNKHQAAVYNMLLRQADYASEKIQEMVRSAMSQCRRDLLWQRMLLPSSVTEEEGRRKRRSEQDETKDPFLTRLSFTEFQELMSIVKQVRLQEMDSQLVPLENMSMPWYLALVRVLRNKYAESHRYFASPDGLVQYVVVLNPNYLDMFMMLTVDSLSHKTELTAGYRERMLDQSHTPTNPNLPAFAMQTHVESFVNTCFYHMWTRLL